VGFYRFSADGEWTNYTGQFFEVLQGRSRYTSIHVGQDGNAWAGSEGGGVALVTPEGEVAAFDKTNSSLLPATGTTDFIIVGGVATDADGTLWSSTRGSSRPLHLRAGDGTWTALPPLTGQGLNLGSTAYGRLFIDSSDQKWIIIHDEFEFGRKRGLAVLDAGSDAFDPADDVFQFFDRRGGAGEGLPSIDVNVVTEDRDGLIWIGTDSGLAFMINTGIVASDPGAVWLWPFWADRTEGTFALFGLTVNDIAVDPANRLWVATNEGAWLLQVVEGGGYVTVEHFTTDNSPLLSDEVVSVAIDEGNGRVYFATSQGLISYQGDAVRPVASAQDLFIYPNPVLIQGSEAPAIYIEGLVEQTELRILAPHGGLVARLAARGGRVRWDGRDLDDNLVASGIYLVVAVGQDGDGTAYGKVAVIR
jgi:sugar lactone lactonase YvrE